MSAAPPHRERRPCVPSRSPPGGPEVLRACERPDPVPRPGELLIAVQASGVNRPDVLQRKGLYPMPPGVSDLPGWRSPARWPAARRPTWRGRAGAGRPRLRAGGRRRLCRASAWRRPASACRCRPADDIEAASLPETFFTVWQNVFEIARLQPGETLLVQGGSSGIGVTAIQLAKALGARSSSPPAATTSAPPAWRWAPTTPSTTARRTSSPRSSA
jgi:NADPH:quinone reductase